MKKRESEQFEFFIGKNKVTAEYHPRYFPTMAHIELYGDCISETGYTSRFVAPSVVSSYEKPLDYIKQVAEECYEEFKRSGKRQLKLMGL